MTIEGRQTGAGFTAMVLCGGGGTRLRAVVSDRPKPLAEVGGEPFLLRLLDQLAAAGCHQAILCTGHLGELIERECGGDHDGVELLYSREGRALGTAGALLAALPLVEGDDALVLNGDSYVDVDLGAFVRRSRRARRRAALLAVTVADAARFGTVRHDVDGAVTAFSEKTGECTPGLVNAGAYWLRREVIAAFPEHVPCSLEREVLPALVGAGLYADVQQAAFLDIGTPSSYAAAAAFFAALERGRRPRGQGLLVVDRDGTLIEERHYLADPAGVVLLPGVIDGLRQMRGLGYEIAIVTNQSGIGRGYFAAAAAAAVNAEVVRQLAAAGVAVQGVYVCPHRPDEGCGCRKPATGMLEQALAAGGYGPEHCVVVGDKPCDVDLGRRLGARTVLVRTGYGAGVERDGACTPDLIIDRIDQLAPEVAR